MMHVGGIRELRIRSESLDDGDYLAKYTGELESDPGSRCGYSDVELAEIASFLLRRNLLLRADDIGLRVVKR